MTGSPPSSESRIWPIFSTSKTLPVKHQLDSLNPTFPSRKTETHKFRHVTR
jgi:hypothetical protein